MSIPLQKYQILYNIHVTAGDFIPKNAITSAGFRLVMLYAY
ncbi:hypothetical protein ACQYRI_09315 [Salmonella enterica]